MPFIGVCRLRKKSGNSVSKIVALYQIVQVGNGQNSWAELPMGWIATRKPLVAVFSEICLNNLGGRCCQFF